MSSHRGPPVLGAVALLVGICVLVIPLGFTRGEPLSWESLLAPYSRGAPLPDDFRVAAIRRGAWNDIVISVDRPGDTAAVEVHVLPRGRWTGVRESRSFAIGYEIPHSPASDSQRDAVTEALADAVRSRDRGLPPPDAIPLGSSFDPSAMPSWLEALRGWRGLLLGGSLALLGLLAVLQTWGVGLAGVALGAADLLERVVGLPVGQPSFGGILLVLVAAGLMFLALRGRAALPRQERLLAVAIGATAVSLRLALGPWGPLHTNGYAPLFVAGAAGDPEALAAYGPGYVELFAPISGLAAANPDWAIFAGNALLSGLVPVLAFVLARLAGLAQSPAMAVALLLAIDPVAIRMAASESYFPSIIVLCTAASVALLAAPREQAAGSPWRAAACMVGAGLLLAQAARIHPVAWGVVATVPFIVFVWTGRHSTTAGRTESLPPFPPGGDGAPPSKEIAHGRAEARPFTGGRFVAFLACAAVAGGAVVATSGGALLEVFAGVRSGTVMRPSVPPLAPLGWATLGAALYAVVAPRRQKWLAVPAGVAVATWLMTRHAYGQSWIWQQSYDRLYLTVPLLAVVGALPARLWRRRWIVGTAAVLVAFAWMWFGLPIVTGRTTDHLEYRWLRERIAQLPSECRVVHLASADKRALLIPTYLGTRSAVAMDLREPYSITAGLSPAPCLVYVRTSLCSSPEGRPACESIERHLTLAALDRASFPARPSSHFLTYDRDPVETVISRVENVRLEGGAPSPPR